jgi:hypothetical protein
MKGYDYITQRQIAWARRHGIKLEHHAGEDGYVANIEYNLREPLLDSARAELERGGRELVHGAPGEGHAYAVYSSTVLSCNFWHYWRRLDLLATPLEFCDLPATQPRRAEFEHALPRLGYQLGTPNLDLLITEGAGSLIGVESKLREPYGRNEAARKDGMQQVYLDREALWNGLAHTREYSRLTALPQSRNRHLDSSQLVKHILGLRASRRPFKMLYLWYDVPGSQGQVHRDETEEFAAALRADGVDFSHATYQSVIGQMARKLRSDHMHYIDYLAERYL